MKHYTGIWRNGAIHTVLAANGDLAWKMLVKWADANHIQNPTNFIMNRR